MAIYTFINGEIKHVFTYNPRIRIEGIIRKITEGYTFINGDRKKLFGKWSFDHTEVYNNNTTEELTIGKYQVVCRGAGGAGGENGGARQGTAQAGGAGGKGDLTVSEITIPNVMNVDIVVGEGGLTKTNGGNGGSKGASSGIGASSDGGAGGGGGMPSYLHYAYGDVYANGGGGGGGAGGNAINSQGRYEGGSGSGGGGGYYKFINSTTIQNIAGKNGKRGAGYWVRGVDGEAGNTTDFPDITSGGGGTGQQWNGSFGNNSNGASGGGASGGSGGGGADNSDYSSGGSGGGGAGGSTDAGGGKAGMKWVNVRNECKGQDASNHHTVPTDTLAENMEYGVNNNYGIGGSPNQNGSKGFVLIRRIDANAERLLVDDLGLITENVTETIDCGSVADNVVDTINLGTIII